MDLEICELVKRVRSPVMDAKTNIDCKYLLVMPLIEIYEGFCGAV